MWVWSLGVGSRGVTSGCTRNHWDFPGVPLGVGGISGAMGAALGAPGKPWGFKSQAAFL